MFLRVYAQDTLSYTFPFYVFIYKSSSITFFLIHTFFSPSVSPSVAFSLSLSLSYSPSSLYHTLSISISLSPSLSIDLSFSFFLTLSISLSLWLADFSCLTSRISSKVTRPAVPPYSSTTMAKCNLEKNN